MLKISGIILCGGKSRRMGQDKGLMPIDGQAMVCQVAKAFNGAQEVLLNCNEHHEQYQALGFATFADKEYGDIEANAGPLLGILSAMDTAKNDWLLFSPCDTPSLPEDYLQVMAQHASDQLAFACVVFDGVRQQHLHVLLHKRFKESLMMYLLSGRRRTSEWLASIKPIEVNFSQQTASFNNINCLDDIPVK
ncbi:MAG: molybdopterin-guanine dinucleotide biosynthesis protein A [Bermanella sp.]|jgi:molybdopterin-guanine dinucleotide biosynthesis protein A